MEAARRRSRSSDSESEAHEAELQRKRGGLVSQRDSSSPSYARFDSRARREREEIEARQRYEREKRQPEQEAELRRARRIAEHNEDISLRAAVPPAPLRAFLRPIVGQKDILQDTMGGLTAAEKQRGEDRRIRQRMEAEEEAMRQRLRDRQMSTRRFSTGPGYRRHRVLYDDGVYRWEDDVSSAMAVSPPDPSTPQDHCRS